MNWKKPQKYKRAPRLLSMIVDTVFWNSNPEIKGPTLPGQIERHGMRAKKFKSCEFNFCVTFSQPSPPSPP